MRHQRVYVALYCDHKRVRPEEALFRPFPLLFFPNMVCGLIFVLDYQSSYNCFSDQVFELHHKCCCPDACAFNDDWEDWLLGNSSLGARLCHVLLCSDLSSILTRHLHANVSVHYISTSQECVSCLIPHILFS
jgi:hypothetical protein